MARLALLAGFFLVPLALLALGHRLRERSPAQKGAFWGGVVGHSAAIVVAVVALHYPPVLWSGDARVAIAFWSTLLGGALGAVVGLLRTRLRAAARS
jgi:uncharacterized membrane protein